MKRSVLAMALMSAVFGVQAANLEAQAEKSGYAVGVDFGRTLAELNTEEKQLVDFDSVVVGFRDAFQKQALKMTDEEMNKALETLSTEAQAVMQQKMENMHKEAAEASKKFLEENAKKEGVKTTESGLQYIVMKEGDGKQPTKDDTVTVSYAGRLVDGTVFDKSDEPVSFGVGQVIDGWVEGIQLMKEGSEYTFFIPAELAYGDFGQPSAGIMPGAALIFDVKLIEIAKPQAEEKTEATATEANADAEKAEATTQAPEAAEKTDATTPHQH